VHPCHSKAGEQQGRQEDEVNEIGCHR
jgi:hypothetical protein